MTDGIPLEAYCYARGRGLRPQKGSSPAPDGPEKDTPDWVELPEREVWGEFYIDHAWSPLAMARATKLFKQISNVHIEAVSTNDWSSFLKIEKQDPAMRSAYVEKVRISWVLSSDEPGGENEGLLFVASHDSNLDSSTPANNDGQIISASASRGAAGVVTLPIKRRVTVNYDGSLAGTTGQLLEGMSGAPIFCHVYKAETGSDASFYMVIETWGRWFRAESL